MIIKASGAGARAVGGEQGQWSLMIMSDTCATCRSRVQRRSSERIKAQHPPTSTHWWQSTTPTEVWDLRVSDASWCHHREAQNHFPERFHSPFLAGGMKFPPLSGMLSPWQFSSDTWKLSSSVFTWLLLLLLHKKKIHSVSFLNLSLSS